MNVFKKIRLIGYVILWNFLTCFVYASAPIIVDTQYAYLEVYRNEPTTLIFEAQEGEDIHLHQFTSFKYFQNASDKGESKVQIRNIYAFLSSPEGTQVPNKKTITKTLVIPKNPKYMTHFHIVFSKGIKLDVNHDHPQKK